MQQYITTLKAKDFQFQFNNNNSEQSLEKKNAYRITDSLPKNKIFKDRFSISIPSSNHQRFDFELKCESLSKKFNETMKEKSEELDNSVRKTLPFLNIKKAIKVNSQKIEDPPIIKTTREKRYQIIEKYQPKLLTIRFYNPKDKVKRKNKGDYEGVKIISPSLEFQKNVSSIKDSINKTIDPSISIQIKHYTKLLGEQEMLETILQKKIKKGTNNWNSTTRKTKKT